MKIKDLMKFDPELDIKILLAPNEYDIMSYGYLDSGVEGKPKDKLYLVLRNKSYDQVVYTDPIELK